MTFDLDSVKQVVVELWDAAWDRVAEFAFPDDLDLTFDEDEDGL